MPVARIITLSPADSEELRRQLTAAGYSVKFAAPDEEFSDADIVVAAANVHADYALQYAAEVAAEADADVIVARGVVAGSHAVVNKVEPVSHERTNASAVVAVPHESDRPERAVPAAGILFGTANELKSVMSEGQSGLREKLERYSESIGSAWQELKHKRELTVERKRLELEQRE